MKVGGGRGGKRVREVKSGLVEEMMRGRWEEEEKTNKMYIYIERE